MLQPQWKTVRRFLKKLKIEPPYHPAILPGYISPKAKNTNSKGTCTPVFIEILFTPARIWKQTKCPPTDAWIKMFYTHTHTHTHTHTDYYSAIKKDKICNNMYVLRAHYGK